MKTLVAIYNHNLPKLTDQLVKSLKPYQGEDYDIMVIDIGSDDDRKAKHTTHEIPTNIYYGGGINFAFRHFLSTRDYDSLLSLNNDLILHGPNFVKTLRDEMMNNQFTILSPCVLQPEYLQHVFKTMHCWNSDRTRQVKWVDFPAPLIHRRFIEEVRQYPDELIYGWGLPVLSGIICSRHNWQIGVMDNCPVIHLYSATFRSGRSDITFSDYRRKAKAAMLAYFQENNLMEEFRDLRRYAANYAFDVRRP